MLKFGTSNKTSVLLHSYILKSYYRFRWHRGGRLVSDIVSQNWTIDPVTLDHRTNFSCRGINAGGEGEADFTSIDVLGQYWNFLHIIIKFRVVS